MSITKRTQGNEIIVTVTKTKMIDSKASFALLPNTKLAAINALHKGMNWVPTSTPNDAHTMMTYA